LKLEKRRKEGRKIKGRNACMLCMLCMYECIDGWLNGLIDGWIDVWMDGWMN
jgi:succinate dehydrogenase/fumarate reductase-like Fe-S protein